MRWESLALVAFWTAAACSFNGGGIGDDSTSDARADDDGAPDDGAAGDAPDGTPPTCEPMCLGDMLRGCDGDTPATEPILCPLGCSTDGVDHYLALVPSNGATAADLEGVTDGLDVTAGIDVYIDTTTGLIESDDGISRTVIRAAGDDIVDGMRFRTIGDRIAVLAVSSLSVDAGVGNLGGNLIITGDNALIILSRDAVSIVGFVDLSGGCYIAGKFSRSCHGPGGGDGSTGAGVAAGGCAPGGNGTFTGGAPPESGAGGGGFGQSGAKGGDGDPTHVGGAGGNANAVACPGPDLVPLQGGSGGGSARTDVGGAGGGALQITSMTAITMGDLLGGGTIHAGGVGGSVTSSEDGGGGGGAGGGILLEAPNVTITSGLLLANGGAGGAGHAPDTPGDSAPTNGNGESGRFVDAHPAAGGSGGGTQRTIGRGGDGGAGVTLPGAGSNVDGGGGGGGGAGIIRINTPRERDLEIIDLLESPAHTRGDAQLQ
jgi:hypothetical protein